MHCMIDFETLATTPDAVVLSLGAVITGVNHNGERFHDEKEWFFKIEDQERVIDPATEQWWDKRDSAAKEVFRHCAERGVELPHFAQEFSDWIKQYKQVKIWGNGALFDIAILNDIFAQHAVPKTWKYTNEMCYRTIKKLFDIEARQIRHGTHHNALDDARFQMQCLMAWIDKGGLH